MPTVAERFWPKVQKSDGCWNWKASVRGIGYGQFWNGQKDVPAHRASWEMANGPIPDGLHVLHRCDNKLCVRPDHLFLGTHTDNMRDMNRKGYTPRGESGGRAKRTTADIQAIRTLHAAGISQADLARNYGVTSGYINQVVKRIIWTHV